jgi:hypothetical protein
MGNEWGVKRDSPANQETRFLRKNGFFVDASIRCCLGVSSSTDDG